MGHLRPISFVRASQSILKVRQESFPRFLEPAWRIIAVLADPKVDAERSINAVAAASHLPVTSALRAIHSLEGEGLVKREASPLDRRLVILSLTPKGCEAINHLEQRWAELLTSNCG